MLYMVFETLPHQISHATNVRTTGYVAMHTFTYSMIRGICNLHVAKKRTPGSYECLNRERQSALYRWHRIFVLIRFLSELLFSSFNVMDSPVKFSMTVFDFIQFSMRMRYNWSFGFDSHFSHGMLTAFNYRSHNNNNMSPDMYIIRILLCIQEL